MAYATASTTSRIDFLPRIRAASTGLFEAWIRHRMYRDTLNQLNTLSDRELQDLGLSRSGLQRAAWESANQGE